MNSNILIGENYGTTKYICIYIFLFFSLFFFFSLSDLWDILNKIQNPCNYLELSILSYIIKIYINNIYKIISFNNQKITKFKNTKRNERENPKATKKIDKTQDSNLTKINIIQLYWTDWILDGDPLIHLEIEDTDFFPHRYKRKIFRRKYMTFRPFIKLYIFYPWFFPFHHFS